MPDGFLQIRHILQADDCVPSNEISLRIATFFVLSILTHAATLHSAPGQRRRVVFARGIGMIFSPVTAGLCSLNILGRMAISWINIISRTVELLARIMSPQVPQTSQIISERRHTVAVPSHSGDFAYEKRLDICPVDRLYQNPRLSHTVIIAEFVWTTFNALLVPMVLLAVVGSWTRFQTSTYGVSLGFNILALFGLPFIQFILGTSHSYARLRRDLKGRKKHGTPYWEPRYQDADKEKGQQMSYWKRMTKQSKERSPWWDLIAQSVGLYFPARKTIIVAYVVLVVGVALCEFTLVGLNLMRTLNCDMTLQM